VKRLLVLVAAALLVVAASCDTKNIGVDPFPVRLLVQITANPNVDVFGNDFVDFTANIIGGTAPYTTQWNFGGDADPNTPTGTPVNVQVLNTTDGNITLTATVTVTDTFGITATATYDLVVGPVQNIAPEIGAVTYANGVLTVPVTDADGNDVTVMVTVPAGLAVATDTVVVAGGAGDAVFNWTATDMFAGGSGTTDITADDGEGGTDTASEDIDVDPIVLDADTIYAIPMMVAGGVATSGSNNNVIDGGDTFPVVIATGVPANAFQYLNGVGLTVEGATTGGAWDLGAGGVYVAATFNVGALGGNADAVDGFWADMGPGSFLMPPDNFIQPTDIGGGRIRISFNLTPIGGSDVTTASGALINFEMAFGAAGTYTLGFQDVSGVNRTYYSDGANTEYLWGTLHADETGTLNVAGVNNEITVN
jgi:hypothetical protein